MAQLLQFLRAVFTDNFSELSSSAAPTISSTTRLGDAAVGFFRAYPTSGRFRIFHPPPRSQNLRGSRYLSDLATVLGPLDFRGGPPRSFYQLRLLLKIMLAYAILILKITRRHRIVDRGVQATPLRLTASASSIMLARVVWLYGISVFPAGGRKPPGRSGDQHIAFSSAAAVAPQRLSANFTRDLNLFAPATQSRAAFRVAALHFFLSGNSPRSPTCGVTRPPNPRSERKTGNKRLRSRGHNSARVTGNG